MHNTAMFIRFLMLAQFLGFSVSCDSNTTSNGEGSYTPRDYFPLITGYSWTYTFYGFDGNPKRDGDGNPSLATTHVISEVTTPEDEIFYKMEFVGLGDPHDAFSGYESEAVLAVGPIGITEENAPVEINFNKETIREILSIQISSVPVTDFEEPVLSLDSSIATINHLSPFESYQNYVVSVSLQLITTWSVFDTTTEDFTFGFRTTEASFEPRVYERSCAATDEAVYTVVENRIISPDLLTTLVYSTLVLLNTPLEIGNRWVYRQYEDEGNTIEHEAEIQAIGEIVIENTTYGDVIEVAYFSPWDTTHYWFGPNIGIVQIQESSIMARLVEYHQ